MGSIHERKRARGTVYEAVWRRADGTPGSKTFKTKAEAKRVLAQLMAREERLRMGLEVAPEHHQVRAAYALYKETAQGLRSWKSMEGRWRLHILPELGDRLLHQLPPEEISSFLRRKLKAGLSPQTVRHLRVHLQRLFTWAKREARIFMGENPASLAWTPELPEPEPKALELEELERVVANAATEDSADFIAVAGYAGLRRGEILALQWKDVDLSTRLIDVRRSGTNTTTKGGKSRLVPIALPLLPRLERRKREGRSHFVFPAEDGGMRAEDFDANALFQTALKRAGLVEGYEHTCVARRPRAPGAKNGRAKLTEAQVLELKRLAEGPTSRTELARRFGVSRRTVGLVVAGERWNGETHTRGGCGYAEKRPDKSIKRCPTCDTPLWPRPLARALHFKDLRSTFITHVVEATGDIRAGQEMAGHASQATTSRHYKKTRAAHLVAQLDRVQWATNAGPKTAAESSPTKQGAAESNPMKTEGSR